MNKHIAFVVIAAAFILGCSAQKTSTATAAIPATLPGNICVVSNEKIGEGGMGEVFRP